LARDRGPPPGRASGPRRGRRPSTGPHAVSGTRSRPSASNSQRSSASSAHSSSTAPASRKPLTLTEAGERLLVHARAIQASLATAEAELGAGADTTQLRVGVYQSVAAHLLPHVMRELGRTAPHVELLLDDCSGDVRLVASLDRGDLDACFVDLPLPFDRGLHKEALAIGDYVLVVPRNGSPAAPRESVRPAELRGLKLISFKSSGSTQRVIDHLRADGIEPQFAPRSDDNNVVQGFVAAGFGAALIPRLAADLLSDSLDVLPFEPALPPRIIALAWTRDLATAPCLQTFVTTTRRVAGRIWQDRAVPARAEAVAGG